MMELKGRGDGDCFSAMVGNQCDTGPDKKRNSSQNATTRRMVCWDNCHFCSGTDDHTSNGGSNDIEENDYDKADG